MRQLSEKGASTLGNRVSLPSGGPVIHKIQNKPLAITVAILLTVGSGASFAQAIPGVTDKTITIGSCSALEGPSHALGTEQIKGAQAYFDLINDEGGARGSGKTLRLYLFF